MNEHPFGGVRFLILHNMKGLDVKWFKHYVGMTNDEKLKVLYEMYGEKGFASIVMWSKILEKAAQDGGNFRVGDGIAYNDNTLKVAFSDVNRFYGIEFIKEMLSYFVTMNMISVDIYGMYQVTNWEKHQGTTLSTARVQKFRVNKELEDQVDEVMVNFNKLTGKSYSSKTESYREKIRARLTDGYTLDQIKAVIIWKQREWGGKADMKKYVTPDTLFRPGHFDRYINEIPTDQVTQMGSGLMINVTDVYGSRSSITQEQFDRAEKGFFTKI